MTDANKQIAELAILATEQLLGRELAKKDEQARFVTEFLAEQNGSASVMRQQTGASAALCPGRLSGHA